MHDGPEIVNIGFATPSSTMTASEVFVEGCTYSRTQYAASPVEMFPRNEGMVIELGSWFGGGLSVQLAGMSE